MALERLPFELAKPSNNTYVTQANQIGYGNGSIDDELSTRGLTNEDLSIFTRVGLPSNRIAYYFQADIIGSGEIVVSEANKQIAISAGTSYDSSTYQGDEVRTDWVRVTEGNPARIKFLNSSYVCVKAIVTTEEEEDFLSSLKFSIKWFSANSIQKVADGVVKTSSIAANAVTAEKISDRSVTTSKVELVESLYFTNGSKPSFVVNKNSSGKVTSVVMTFPANEKMKLFSSKRSSELYLHQFGTTDIEYTIPFNNSLLYDVATDSFSVTRYSNTGANKVTILSVEGFAFYGLLTPYLPVMDIATQAVTEDNIKDGSINTQKIGDNAVTNGKIMAKAITDEKIAYNTIQYNDYTPFTFYDCKQTASSTTYNRPVYIVPLNNSGNIRSISAKISQLSPTIGMAVTVCASYTIDSSDVLSLSNTRTNIGSSSWSTSPIDASLSADFSAYHYLIIRFDGALTSERKAQFEANGLVLSLAGDSLFTTVDNLKQSIGSIDYTDIVNGYNAKYSGVIADLKRGCDFNALFFSDIHGRSAELERIIQYGDTMKDSLDCIIDGGDDTSTLTSTAPPTWADSIIADGELPCIRAVGNHDAWASDYWVWDTAQNIYNLITSKVVTDLTNKSVTIHQPSDVATTYKNYYYVDFGNVRAVVLISMSGEHYWDSSQSSWFEGVLADALTNDKHVLVVNHAPLSPDAIKESESWPNWNSHRSWEGYSTGREPHVNDAQHLSSAAITLVDSFISDGGHFIAYIAGHTHTDYVLETKNAVNKQFCVVTSCARANPADSYTPDIGSLEFDLFNWIAIDTDKQVFKMLRLGNGKTYAMNEHSVIVIDYRNARILASAQRM